VEASSPISVVYVSGRNPMEDLSWPASAMRQPISVSVKMCGRLRRRCPGISLCGGTSVWGLKALSQVANFLTIDSLRAHVARCTPCGIIAQRTANAVVI
jgi:hypothetical protein